MSTYAMGRFVAHVRVYDGGRGQIFVILVRIY